MKLYEINEAIDALLASLTVDPETGEIPGDADEIIAQLDELSMDRQKVLEYLAKKVLNLRSDIDALNGEIERLEDRKDHTKKHIDSIMKVLDRECGGVKVNLGVATVQYRTSKETVVSDEEAAVEWWDKHKEDYPNAITVTAPKYTVNKTEVKKIIGGGTEVPGCAVVEKHNCSLK